MYTELLKRLLEHSAGNNVDIKSFLSTTRDTQELRDSLKTLENLGYIKVVYSSGEIYDIDLLPSCIEYSKTL